MKKKYLALLGRALDTMGIGLLVVLGSLLLTIFLPLMVPLWCLGRAVEYILPEARQ